MLRRKELSFRFKDRYAAARSVSFGDKTQAFR